MPISCGGFQGEISGRVLVACKAPHVADTREHHVYLLIDPRKRGGQVFYVGQGVGSRAGDHAADAAKWDRAGRPALGAVGRRSGEERCSKYLRILEIVGAGRRVGVEFLRTGLSKSEADLVETVAIDLLVLERLTNQVHGPKGAGRVSSEAFDKVSRARPKQLSHRAVVVPTQGRWGGSVDHGGLLAVDDAAVWENAHHIWAMSEANVARLAATARDHLVLLIGLQSGKAFRHGVGLVVGVWSISHAEFEGWKFDKHGNKRPGFQFIAGRPNSAVHSARTRYLGHRLLDSTGKIIQPQVGVRYFL